MSWATHLQHPYSVVITDGYLGKTERSSESAIASEQFLADRSYSRAKKLHVPAGKRNLAWIPSRVHVMVIGNEGWITHAPSEIRKIADIRQVEINPDYRMVAFGFDTSTQDPEWYFPDMASWVYNAGLTRQKVRAWKDGFQGACKPFLNSFRDFYLEHGTAPTLILDRMGVPFIFHGDK